MTHAHLSIALMAAGLLALCANASGQNLLEQAAGNAPAAPPTPAAATPASADGSQPATPAPQQPANSGNMPQASATASYSLFAVVTPRPKAWAKHDLVEIIINESNLQKFEQTQDLKKNSTLKGELTKFPSLRDLITEAALNEGIGATKPGFGVSGDSKFKGEGKFNRKDQITARITATVLDVKPNGTLVLEARETVQSDREISTMVISGTCRSEDITRTNTVQSSQLANLNLRIEHEGDVKDTSEKGLIPRVIDTIFNF